MSFTNKASIRFPEPQDIEWMADALCRNIPYEQAMALFFPEKGNNFKEGKRFCLGTPASKGHPAVPPCPVLKECLAYALSFEPEGVVGVWGGTTAAERRKLLLPPAPPPAPTVRSYRNLERLSELVNLVSAVNREADNVDP